MKQSFKNLFIALFVILISNVFFKQLLYRVFDGNFFLYSLVFKMVLILLILLFIYKSQVFKSIKITSRNIPYVLFSITLLVSSYFYLEKIISQSVLERNNMSSVLFLFSCIATGIFEELTFRVFTYNILLDILKNRARKIVLSAVYASLLFSVAHIGNIFLPNFHVFSLILQMVFAFAVGLVLQATYIRTKSLTLIMSLHAIINYFGSYKSYLFEPADSAQEADTLMDFFSSLFFIILFLVLIVWPIFKLLIRKEVERETTSIVR